MKLFKRIGIAVLLVFLCAGAAMGYAFLIEPHRLVVKEYQLKAENAGKDSIKVIQLSDLEVSENYKEEELEQLVKKVNSLSPDIITFTGDLFHNYAKYKPVERVTESLGLLDARYGKYAVWGNRDYGGGASRQYQEIMENAGFKVLKNEGIHLDVSGGKKIFIGGLDDGLLGKPDLEKALQQKEESVYQILLCHEPDLVDSFEEIPVNLILAGHSHGGQVSIPFWDGITTSMAQRYRNGFYELDSRYPSQIYVNSGLGTSRIPVRFMVPPQIAVFNISI